MTGKPALGIGSSSLLAAAASCDRAAILVISEKSVPRKVAFAKRLGLKGRFFSVPTGYTEHMTEAETLECLMKAAREALREGAGALVLGCAGMGSAASEMRRILGVPVIDGTEVAVRALVLGNAGR